jgi:hypothetical protein
MLAEVRMLRSRVQQVEQAIAEGRLDDACSLLRDGQILGSERGQQAARVLVAMLLERGRIHLAAGRLIQARADADRGLMLGGNQPDVAQLRDAIANAIENDAQRDRKRVQLLADARQQIDRGRLKLGEKWLHDVSVVESRAANLLRELDVKKSMLESAIQAANAAMDRQDLSAATREITLARDADATDARVTELTAKISETLLTKLGESMDAGRLDRTESHVQQLAAVCGETADVQQYRRTIEQCRSAWGFLGTGEPGKASEVLKRLAMVFPSAEWIQTAIEHAKQAEIALTELRSGPLALLCSTGILPVPAPAPLKRQMHGQDARATGGASALPTRFVLRVDGVGSFVVFRQTSVTIGPISSSQQPDLGLLAEPGVPVATIERREDDYFIRGSAVAVNDRPGTGKLLAAGDRIALSPRCRMSFNLPSAASTTAILDLTGCRYPRADVRRVILLDRDIILGPGIATHVRVDGSDENVILHIRDGRLFCEAKGAVEVNGAMMDRMMGIPMEAQVRVGSVSFVVSST